MPKFPTLDAVLVLPHLHIQNANTISSPLTHGFPSMTAFTGLMWALERKANTADVDLHFPAVGVVVHQHEEQTTSDRYVKSFRLSRNPNDREGKPSPIVEEGRIHLELTLLFGVEGAALNDPANAPHLASQLMAMLQTLRLAGGSIIPPLHQTTAHRPYFMPLTGNDEDRLDIFAASAPNWLPGFTLVERSDLLEQRHADLRQEDPDATPLDAWLSLSRINWRASEVEASGKTTWHSDRKGLGWVVPIPVGYSTLTPLLPAGSVPNARDSETPMRLVESIFSVGEWLSPHRLESIEQMLWYPSACVESGLYRCHNDYQPEPEISFD
ncbi:MULTISPECIES: type I-F CRISPR-associated protein Csy2 [unclassified Pseudomonas]|uniref:type I-F CRISPR-associated protein Csy2 n=1 Tax=unclassified Pseudomonas TaxID=196821 RepID=UPI0035C148AB